MRRIKGINVLKAELLDLIEEIINSLNCELQRIGRKVELKELKFNPFNQQVSPYMEAVGLDGEAQTILYTSFADISVKSLRGCICDLEIDVFGLLDLLEFLKALPGKNGALASILKPLTGECIGHEEQDRDAWVCVCGNTPDRGGFYSCDEDGDLIEPGNDWNNLYRCESCGRVINDRDLKVIGMNLNPNDEERL